MECNGRYGCSFFRIFLSYYLVFKPSLFHKTQFVVSPSYRFHIFSLLLSRFINLPYFTQYILSFLSSHSRFFVFLLVTIFFFITNLPHFTNYIFSFLPSFANQTKNNRLKSSLRHLPIFLFLTTPTAALSSLLPPLPRSLFPLSPTLHLFRPFHSSPRRFPSSIPRSLTSRIFNLAP